MVDAVKLLVKSVWNELTKGGGYAEPLIDVRPMMEGVCTLLFATSISVVVCDKTLRNVAPTVPPTPKLFATNILRFAVIFPANRLPTIPTLVDTFKALAVRVERTLKLPLTVEKAVLGGYAKPLMVERFTLDALINVPVTAPPGPIRTPPIFAFVAVRGPEELT
jgi:hypothetical protein